MGGEGQRLPKIAQHLETEAGGRTVEDDRKDEMVLRYKSKPDRHGHLSV